MIGGGITNPDAVLTVCGNGHAWLCRRRGPGRRPPAPAARVTGRIGGDSFNLVAAEQELCIAALDAGGGIVPAARLRGVTCLALKRRILKHNIEWPRHRPSGV